MGTRRSRITTFLTFCVLSCFLFSAYVFSAEPETEEKSSPMEETEQGTEGTDEAEADMAEWTIMLYLCGTDLESDGGMATGNLEMISKTIPFFRQESTGFAT